MKKKLIYITTLLTAVIFIGGCKQLDLTPENRFTELTYWSTEEQARTVLNTAYSQIFKSERFFYNEGLSDNAYNGRGDTEGAASIAAGIYDASLSRLKSEWGDGYAAIKTCNLLLENIDRVPNLDPAIADRMKAEARFIRAFKHFQLMTWFGDVPLIQQDISITEAQTLSRTPRSEVLAFVLSELDAVVPALPINTALPESERGRITQGAVIGLKARVLLYEGRWQDVVTETEMLINNTTYGEYGLFSSYEGLFLPQNEYNSEDIFSLQYVPINRTWNQFFDMAPLSVGGRLNALAPTQELVDSYLMSNGKTISESGSGYNDDNPYINRDPRLTATVVYHLYKWADKDGNIKTIYTKPGTDPDDSKQDEYAPGGSTSPTGYYWRKYFDPTHSSQMASGLNLMMIRYADILLMYAESKNELGQLDQTVWNQTIRALRERAGFTDAEALTFNIDLNQSELREIIRNERRVELALEGLRIFDIRRWKIAEEVLNGWVHGAKFGVPSENGGYLRVNQRSFDPAKHYLWPVPRDERNINPNLGQNPGWN